MAPGVAVDPGSTGESPETAVEKSISRSGFSPWQGEIPILWVKFVGSSNTPSTQCRSANFFTVFSAPALHVASGVSSIRLDVHELLICPACRMETATAHSHEENKHAKCLSSFANRGTTAQ